eukprot:g2058.t1
MLLGGYDSGAGAGAGASDVRDTSFAPLALSTSVMSTSMASDFDELMYAEAALLAEAEQAGELDRFQYGRTHLPHESKDDSTIQSTGEQGANFQLPMQRAYIRALRKKAQEPERGLRASASAPAVRRADGRPKKRRVSKSKKQNKKGARADDRGAMLKEIKADRKRRAEATRKRRSGNQDKDGPQGGGASSSRKPGVSAQFGGSEEEKKAVRRVNNEARKDEDRKARLKASRDKRKQRARSKQKTKKGTSTPPQAQERTIEAQARSDSYSELESEAGEGADLAIVPMSDEGGDQWQGQQRQEPWQPQPQSQPQPQPQPQPQQRRHGEEQEEAAPAAAPAAPAALTEGSAVRVLSPSKNWRMCTVVDTDDSRVKVHYDGYDEMYDEWLSKDDDERIGREHGLRVPPSGSRSGSGSGSGGQESEMDPAREPAVNEGDVQSQGKQAQGIRQEAKEVSREGEEQEEAAAAAAPAPAVLLMEGQTEGETGHDCMGFYTLVEGKRINGRAVWRRDEAGDEELALYLYYHRAAVASKNEWWVADRESMEKGDNEGYMSLAVTIQRNVRMRRARGEFRAKRRGAVTIQSMMRQRWALAAVRVIMQRRAEEEAAAAAAAAEEARAQQEAEEARARQEAEAAAAAATAATAAAPAPAVLLMEGQTEGETGHDCMGFYTLVEG